MGTNYHIEVGWARLRFHVGKMSASWQFVFRGYPTDESGIGVVRTIADWRRILQQGDCTIYGESGPVKAEDFWMLVERSRGARVRSPEAPSEWIDPDGWFFIGSEFS